VAKPFDDFSKCRSMKFGLDARCKVCRSEDRKLNRYDLHWSKNNPEKRKEISKKHRDKRRLVCIAHYSNGSMKCACCGEHRTEFLAIDHINGGGAKHRRQLKNTGTIYQWLKRNNYPEGFRILCHNCNMALGHYGYCPHEEEADERS
jgi:hypothetical protein